MKFAAAYSGGKDSALALYRMIQQGHKPIALITAVNIDGGRSWFHGIQKELLFAVSRSLGIPIILSECNPDNYLQIFDQSLKKAREMGAQCCAFGDIDIEGHKAWNEERCNAAGLKLALPLWMEDREALVDEMLRAGFKAMVKIVNGSLDESLLGQDLTPALIEKIKEAGADPCGENGEYHTFVYDGPIFAHPVSFEKGEVIDLGTHRAIDILSIC